ncbi:MAG: nitroreductase family protein [bacterium]
MDLIEIIKNRKSQRTFIDKTIRAKDIEAIIDAARYAATARNIQPWEFIIVTEKEMKNKIAQIATTGSFIAQAAACVIVFCEDTKYYLEDGCAATENILLAATAMGISSCWVAGDKKPYTQTINKLLDVPLRYKLISLIALGYPDEEKEAPEKRPLHDVMHWEKFTSA